MIHLNTLGHSLDRDKRFFDAQSKKILSFKSIQACILQQCVEEFAHLSIDEIVSLIEPSSLHPKLSSFNVEDTSIPEAIIRYDFLYSIRHPFDKDRIIFIHLEAQGQDTYRYSLPRRCRYYTSRLISRQKNDPLGFQNSDFDKMIDIRSIWICLHHAHQKDNRFLEYRTHEHIRRGQFSFHPETYDFSRIYLLYPYILTDVKVFLDIIMNCPKDIMEFLSLLFLSDRGFDDIRVILQEKYGILLTDELEMEVEKMCTFSEGAFLIWQERGLESGLKKGLEKGKLETLVKNITCLIENGTISNVQQAFSILHVDKELQAKVLQHLQIH